MRSSNFLNVLASLRRAFVARVAVSPAPAAEGDGAADVAGSHIHRFRRAYQLGVVGSALMVMTTSCFGGGNAGTVFLRPVQVDLSFGAADKYVPHPQNQQQPSFPQIKIPDFKPPVFPPTDFGPPPLTNCVILKNSPDEAADEWINNGPNGEGDYRFKFEQLGAKDKVVKTFDGVRAVSDTSRQETPGATTAVEPRLGATVPNTGRSLPTDGKSVAANERPNLHSYTMFDEFTGIKSRLRWVPQDEASQTESAIDGSVGSDGLAVTTHPDRGLFMDYIVFPRTLGKSDYPK
ncbi:MAG: hypothetical protein LC663_05070, partial [Actinobacteria bacterium]|nr:hypothetical protein [Actinomycetota bacterium]